MRRTSILTVVSLATLAVVSLRCDDGRNHTDGDIDGDTYSDSDGDGDSEGDGGDASVDGDSEGDSGDADIPTGPGPMGLLVQRLTVATDRLCDLDGDGSLDNSIADLGTTAGGMIAMAISTALASQLEQHGRIMVYLPEVEDRAAAHDLEGIAIIFDGADTDDPRDPTDDWSGVEPFYSEHDFVDACGEPLYYYPSARLDHGEFSAEGETVALLIPGLAPVYCPAVTGTIEPGGVAAEFDICGYSSIPDLGASPGFDDETDLSMLEQMLAGGMTMGLPSLPGISPDLDFDRDGLESFVLDDEGHIVSCVDGDHTVIEGRDCWSDERMADAFALSLHVSCVPARFAGPEPGWQALVEGTCEDPPGESLWGEW